MTKEHMVEAARNADWQQVVLNGGPPCFHLDPKLGRFCLRALRWAGHSTEHAFTDHIFVGLDELLSRVSI